MKIMKNILVLMTVVLFVVNAAKNKKPITEAQRAFKAAQMKQEVLNRIEEMKDMETFEHMEMLRREQEQAAQLIRREQKEEKRKLRKTKNGKVDEEDPSPSPPSFRYSIKELMTIREEMMMYEEETEK